MIITKTPFRMSFFGGGTDFPDFYKEYGGSVLSTSFDKYCYVIVRHLPRFFDYSNQVTYSRIENAKQIDDIKHPAVREAMKYLDMKELHIVYDADLPARSGLGSSSSFAVGMLHAFHALKGKYASKEQLAKEAIYLERELCRESGGIQDQIAASFGGFNRINFSEDGFHVAPVIMSKDRKQELSNNLMLFFSGFSRFSADIQVKTQKAIKDKKKELLSMLEMVDEAEKILESGTELEEFGRLLDDSWCLKRGITADISNDAIDAIYEKAKRAGATGGKLLGAGGGGFLLFYVKEEYQERVKEALHDFLYVPFEFEEVGTQVLYYKPEDYKQG